MTLHRTPVHQTALEMVRANQIVWRDDAGVPGGFAKENGQRITEPGLLVALWELRNASLLMVDARAVRLTSAGFSRLYQWHRTQTGGGGRA